MMTNMSRSDLHRLRFRTDLEPAVYDSVIIVPSPKIAGSGYRDMLIVGIRDGSPVEIAAECDDVMWCGHSVNGNVFNTMRFDMDPANDSVHVWSSCCVFEVGFPGVSTEITLKYRSV